MRRRLAGLFEAGEELHLLERLGLGGWWVLTDKALYVLDRHREVSRMPLGEIHSVRVAQGRATAQVTVTTEASGIAVGDLRRESALVARLQQLASPPG